MARDWTPVKLPVGTVFRNSNGYTYTVVAQIMNKCGDNYILALCHENPEYVTAMNPEMNQAEKVCWCMGNYFSASPNGLSEAVKNLMYRARR